MGATYAYVGSRTSRERGADGEGITVWDAGGPGDGWRRLGTVAADASEARGDAALPANPSFLLVSDDRRSLYVTHGDTDAVSVLDLAADPATPRLVQTVHLGRRNPVHLAQLGRRLLVTFMAGPGCVAELPIAGDGTLGEASAIVEFAGDPGPLAIQQRTGSSPHQAVPDPTGRWALVPDRGLDRVHVVPVDPALAPAASALVTRQAEGPRHVAFHPDGRRAYVVTELRSSLITCDWDADRGVLTPVAVVPSTAPEATYDAYASEVFVTPDGSAVVTSNRSGKNDHVPPVTQTDTLGVFPLDPDGLPGPGRWFSSGGLRPRFFAFAPGGTLTVAHQWDGRIVEFDDAGGSLSGGREVARTGTPTCVAWLDAPRA